MYIPTGKITVIAIIFAIVVQGMGGFILNQQTVTSCESKFDYQTDISGAFVGTGQDIPVDFNPRENITGYYAWDPASSDGSSQQKHAPAIYYSPGSANNYPYANQAVVESTYTLTVECTKGYSDNNHVEHYKATIIHHTESGEIKKEYEWDGQDITKQSGLYSTSAFHILHSYVVIAGSLHEAPRMLNIANMVDHIEELKGGDLYITTNRTATYPAFVANLSVDHQTSLTYNSYILNYNSQYASYMYYDASTSSAEIHAHNYNYTDQWLLFGTENNDNMITVSILKTDPDKSGQYIDPNQGVAPAHAATEYTRFFDKWYFPEKITIWNDLEHGQNQVTVSGMGTQNFDYTIALTVTIDNDLDNPGTNLSKYDTAYINFHGYKVSENQAAMRITFTNPDGGSESRDMAGVREFFYFNLRFTITHSSVTLWTAGMGQEMTVEYPHDYLAGQFSHAGLAKHGESSATSDNAYAQLNLKFEDQYSPTRTPEHYEYSETTKNEIKCEYEFFQIQHESERVPFSSKQTYWYNGYENSTVGMIVQCTPVGTPGGETMPAETMFNIKMHTPNPDPTSTEKYIDKWCYDDELKMAISIWTDPDTEMVYVGHYDKNGVRQDGIAMQVGVCKYAYFELRADKGAVTMWVAPIYEFTNYMEFTPSPMFDQTSAISDVFPTGTYIKSIAELSFNVEQEDGPGPGPEPQPTHTWQSGDCTVTLYDNGELRVSGIGAMQDYPAGVTPPWGRVQDIVTSIHIESGVTTIGYLAFAQMCNVSSIVIGDTVNTIKALAFAHSYNVTSLTFTAESWNIDYDTNQFSFGNFQPFHRAYVTVYLPNNMADGKLQGDLTTFTYLPTPTDLGDSVQTWQSGDCTVSLYDSGKLRVSGNGRMQDYDSYPPWHEYVSQIRSIVIEHGVTYIGEWAFMELDAQEMNKVIIGNTVTEVGSNAFTGSYNVSEVYFESYSWNITSIGEKQFAFGRPGHSALNVNIYSPNNIANGKLDAYRGEETAFYYYETPGPEPDKHAYPRHLIVRTVILLDGGGLYTQDGVMSFNKSFPNDALSELVINAVVHPGDSLNLISGGKTIFTMTNDGVDKWIYVDKQGNAKYYDWWDIQIFYVSNHIDAVDIDGAHYDGQMYLPDGTKLLANHVYIKAGKYGTYDQIGDQLDVVDGRSDLTVLMAGTWAFSTQYYLGSNMQGSHIEFDEPGNWGWSWNETLVVFQMVMFAISIVLFYKYGYNIYDILIMGGAVALLWISFLV